MTSSLVCWKCGASIEEWPLPLSRLAECKACHAELHVCRQCLYYDTGKASQCREPVAEDVREKTRANFCGYFQLRPDAHAGSDDHAAEAARSELEALFGIDENNGA